MKELRKVLFFVGAIFEFTFNDPNKNFNYGQIGLLHKLPTQDNLDNFREIEILAAPPAVKDIEYNHNKQLELYLDEGWKVVKIGVAPEITQSIKGNLQAQRKQYGIKHCVTSTIHASMGDTLNKVAIEISNSNKCYKLWDKGQIVVSLSRT